MSKQRFRVIIFIIILLMIGLLWIQHFWSSYAFKLEREKLNTKLSLILTNVIEGGENHFLNPEFFNTDSFGSEDQIIILKQNTMTLKSDTIYHSLKQNTKSELEIKIQEFKIDSEVKTPTVIHLYLKDSVAISEVKYEGFTQNNQKGLNSIKSTLLKKVLDSLLKLELTKHEFSLDYYYSVTDITNDSLILALPIPIDKTNLQIEISSILFNQSNFFKPYRIDLFFPKKESLVRENLGKFILTTALLVAFLLLVLFFFIRTYFQYRKLAEMKIDFINQMTHEFQTPVSNITLAMDTIERYSDESGKKKIFPILQIVREELSRLKDNIYIVLGTAVVSNNNLSFSMKNIDIHNLLISIIKNIGRWKTLNNLDIKHKFESQTRILKIDKIHFTNIINNLVENAMKYCEKKPEIFIRTYETPGYFHVSITDNGIGIQEEVLPHIFDKYYRNNYSTESPVLGYGLGLAYVKYVVEAHNGKIFVQSELKKGSTFDIQIPIANGKD